MIGDDMLWRILAYFFGIMMKTYTVVGNPFSSNWYFTTLNGCGRISIEGLVIVDAWLVNKLGIFGIWCLITRRFFNWPFLTHTYLGISGICWSSHSIPFGYLGMMIPINAFQTGQGLETANHEGSTFIGVNTGVNIEEGVQGETIVFLRGNFCNFSREKNTMIEGGWSIEKTKPTGVLVLLDYHHLVI